MRPLPRYDEGALRPEDTQRLDIRTASPAPAVGEARLVLLNGPASGRSFDVQRGLTIGRGTDVEVQVEDTSVSRQHARITKIADGRYLLEDLQSRNGTLVNDQPVTHRQLAFGDRIQVGGKALLLFTHHHPLEEQLRGRERLEAIGELSAGIAHDLNNLLGAVLASVDYLRGLPDESRLGDRDVRECVADIVAATVRGSDLTQRLLKFARRGRSSDGPVDVGRVCREVGQLARRTFPRKITVEVKVDDDLIVIGSYSELYHALLNLCINARDAMPDGGVLTIEARQENDHHVLLAVTDTGVGMDEKTAERIFEPFFTTKGAEQGSGLGLSSVQAMIKAHGGRVEVTSAPERGARFTIQLPLRGYRPPPTPDRETPRDGLGQDRPVDAQPVGLLLLVDDDHVLRRSIGRVLRQAGHDLVFASDGEEAVRVYRAAKRRPDLVLLDLDMPRMSGDEAFAQLQKIEPDVRVVVLSGVVTDDHRAALLARGAFDVLTKPCEAPTLVRTIAAALRPG